jgi:Amino acid synthesis
MIEIRKTITLSETVFSELGVEANRSVTRAVGMAVIRNPFAGQFVEDLRPLFEAGAMFGND